MKKLIIIGLVVIMIVMCFSGCSTSINNEMPKDLTISSVSKNDIVELSPDWPIYDTASEIVKASTNIYTGKVNEISFEIIDMVTGKKDDSPESDSSDRMLYTVYTVTVTDSKKGNNPEELKICLIGGIPSYKEEEQYSALESVGLLKEFGGIPVISDAPLLALDTEYLFCTVRTIGDFDFVINQTQFAHRLDSQNYKAIISAIK